VAFGIKAGMVPLHVWLPDAHPVAPSPASALLSGVMIKTGAYGMLRVMYEIFGLDLLRQTGWPSVLLGLSVATILLGSMVAVTQFDLKRRLAYSSVGQMGCILLGMSLMSERALTGDVFHFFADAVAKSCLFLCAGVIMKETGKRDIRQFGGIGHRLPITMACFAIAAFTLVGIPPFNGFISKLQLSLGAFDAGMPGYALALLASSMLNAVYYLPIVITAFFDRAAPAAANGAGRRRLAEAHPTMLAPIVVLALGCAVFALSSENWPLRLSETAARLLLRR
jgi:multicomponent Na+:H+ antiporter subunit D